MKFEWQNLLVLLIVATAAAYLARLAWQSVRRRTSSACGGCHDCTRAGDQPVRKQIVTLDELSKSARVVGPAESSRSS